MKKVISGKDSRNALISRVILTKDAIFRTNFYIADKGIKEQF
jgi:hypothetical protein